jgi:hypothetical protein
MLCIGVNIFLILSFPLVGNISEEEFWTSQNDRFGTPQLSVELFLSNTYFVLRICF